MVRAFYIDTNEEVSFDKLKEIGVLHWHFDADTIETNEEFAKLRKERGYTYKDEVNSEVINLKEKIPMFFEEHIHDDEEIRFFLNGTGYFDVRDGKHPQELWVRIVCSKGDLIVLPAGIYHRFAPDESMFFHVLRLFVGEPVWTPYNRVETATATRPARLSYEKTFLAASA